MLIPVGDYLRTRGPAYVNWAIIAANIAVFIYIVSLDSSQVVGAIGRQPITETDQFFYDWGFVPSCVGDFFGASTDVSGPQLARVCPAGDREAIQPFTSMFLHAGWGHLLGNMLFLWIFGDNVEDAMGHLRYLVFYLIAGLAAAGLQTFFSLDSVQPTVGASGAIAGVMGAYLVMYPTVRIRVIILPLFFIPFLVPAIVLIGIWILTQVFNAFTALGQQGEASGIAWWAHVGGFLAGVVLVWFFRRKRPRRVAEAWESRFLDR